MASVGEIITKWSVDIWEELFDEFLKDNNCFDEFYSNKKAHIRDGGGITSHDDIFNFVMGAFTWSDTLESINFWDEIHDSWNDVIYNSKKVRNTELARKMYPKGIVYKKYLVVKK